MNSIDEVMAKLNEPYDPVQVIKDLLEYAVFDEARNDECIDAVENARGYLEQEARGFEIREKGHDAWPKSQS